MPKTLAEKLLVKTGPTWVDDALSAVDALAATGDRTDDPTSADVAVVAVADRASATERLPRLLQDLAGARAVWIAYRKGNVVDLNRDTLAALVQELGWRPATQIALDEEWSALRFRPLAGGRQYSF